MLVTVKIEKEVLNEKLIKEMFEALAYGYKAKIEIQEIKDES